MPNPVVHWEIGGADAAALREFYAKAFGWKMTDDGPQYTLAEPGEGSVGGGITRTRAEMPCYVTVYVASDDLEAQLAQITTLGGRTVVAPASIDGETSYAMFADPCGNVVGLLKRSKGDGSGRSR